MSALMDLINKKKLELNANNRARTAKIPDKTSRWRILPGWRADKNDPTFYHDFGSHYIKDASKTMKAVYVCTEKTFGRPCEVCAALSNAMGKTDDDSIELLKEANASQRVLVNAVQLDGSAPTTPVVLELAPTVFGNIITIMQEWGDILDIKSGKDLTIERTGTGIGTKYTVNVGAKTTVLPADIMSKVTNLDEYVAQENEQGRIRAISQVNAIAGLIGGTTSLLSDSSSHRPALSDMTLDAEQEAQLELLMASEDGIAAKVDASVAIATAAIPKTEPAKAPKESVTSEPIPVAEVAVASGDDDLDALLASLET